MPSLCLTNLFNAYYSENMAVPIENSWMYRDALKKFGIAVQLFEFEEGRHGFGMINATSEIAWPSKLTEWLKQENIL
jgi:dipeptidyl aminopeptidase/acylaminoacyl peptidase